MCANDLAAMFTPAGHVKRKQRGPPCYPIQHMPAEMPTGFNCCQADAALAGPAQFCGFENHLAVF